MKDFNENQLAKFNISDLLIILLIIAILLSNYIWLKFDEYPIEGHGLSGLTPAVQVYRELKGLGNTYKLYDHILGNYNVPLTPPLSYLIVVLFYFLFGLQGQMVAMVNSLYIAATLMCVYLIGKNIFNKTTGLLAAFILSSFPGFIGFSRVYWAEFGLMAYVSLDLYLLLKTNFFENRKYSILLGVSLALSFLHKYEFILAVIGPLLLVIYKSGILKDIFKVRWSNRATNLILTFILASGLTSFWWIRYGKQLLFWRLPFAAFKGDNLALNNIPYLQSLLSYQSLTFYLFCIRDFIGNTFFLLLFISIIILIIKCKENKKRFYILFFILSISIPYLILNLFLVKSFSHILLVFPSLAVSTVAGVYFIKNRLLKIILIGTVLFLCLNFHLSTFYYSGGLKNFINFISKSNFSIYATPRKEQFERGIKEILGIVKADFNFDSRVEEPRVFVAYKNIELSGNTFEYYSLIGNYRIRFFTTNRNFSDFSEFDYVIVEQHESESLAEILSREYEPHRWENIVLNEVCKNGFNDFNLIKIYNIPKGDTSVFIYKKRANSF